MPAPGEPILKSQQMRLLDVFVIGPLMLYAASRLPPKNRGAALALGFFGVTTIAYNYRNYRRLEALAPAPLPIPSPR